MWTLVVLLAGVMPPTGIVQTGFASEAECIQEATAYCGRSNKKFRCKCIRSTTNDNPTE